MIPVVQTAAKGARRRIAPPADPETREKMAKTGIRFTGEIVAEHVAGQLRAERFIADLSKSLPIGDELELLATEIATKKSREELAYSRGFFRYLQKRLERAA